MRALACLCFAIALSPIASHSITFTNRAASAGVDDSGLANGAVFADYDGDGWPDLLVSRVRRDEPALLYRNLGDGDFALQPGALEGSEESFGATFVDLEVDGDLDIFLLKHNLPNSFFRNESGRYVPMATPNGIRDAAQATGALFGDFDVDGNLDLFTTYRLLTRNRLFSAILTDHATDVTEFTSTLQGGGETVGAVALDYDGDGVRDLYVSNTGTHNLLYRNRADGTFQQLSAAVGLQRPSSSVASIVADYDNDGDADLYVLNSPFGLSTSNELYENRNGERFEEVASIMGLSRSMNSAAGAWADLDNDGDLDLLVSDFSTVTVWRNDGDEFSDVSASAYGLDAAAAGERPVGLTIADYDRDGDVDVFAAGNGTADALLRNDTANSGHWLEVELVASDGRNSPVGSTLHAHVDELELTRDYSIGTSLATVHGDLLHLGTGTADHISELIIEWPSGLRQVLTNLPTDQFLRVEEPRPRRDLAITRIVEPNLASLWGSGLRTEVEIANAGQVPVADARLHVTIVVDGGEVVHTSTMGIPELGAGEAIRLGEDSAWHPSLSGRHRVQFDLEVDDDVAANDRRARVLLMHRFDEVAALMGVDDPGAGFAGAFANYDNDGDLDLYLANGGWSGDAVNVLYRNDGDSGYELVTELAEIADVGNGTGVLFADFDRDGYLDLFAARGGFIAGGQQNRLFHNEGDGTFSDISVSSGLEEVKSSYGVTAGDYDRDGHLDLFVSQVRGQVSTLYRNTGDGRFEDVTEEKGIFHPDSGGGSASAFADYDNDGDLDLYAAIFGGFDLIYSDVGKTVYAFSSLGDRGAAVGLSVGDFEEDGDLDVFVVNVDGLGILWRNDLVFRRRNTLT